MREGYVVTVLATLGYLETLTSLIVMVQLLVVMSLKTTVMTIVVTS